MTFAATARIKLWIYVKDMVCRSRVQRSSIITFFTRNPSRNIHKFTFVWKVNEMTFSGCFFLRGKQISLIPKSRWAHALQKNIFKKIDSKAMYHFCVNCYHTSAVAQSIFLQSSLIMWKFQWNRTKPELIKIFLLPRVTAWVEKGCDGRP